MMNIGEAARQSGLPAKTIRYYEDIGLARPPGRSTNGYRAYSNADIHALRFLQRARGLGFSVQECRDLLALYRDSSRASSDVKTLALHRIGEIDRKIAELRTLRDALVHLADSCAGNDRPDCPILDDLGADLAQN